MTAVMNRIYMYTNKSSWMCRVFCLYEDYYDKVRKQELNIMYLFICYYNTYDLINT